MSCAMRAFPFMVFIAFLLVADNASAEVLFEDGFESGDLMNTSNHIVWSGTSNTKRVSSSRPLRGKYAMEFMFRGKPPGEDSAAEQRIKFRNKYTELWIKYDMYIPENYYHRKDGASNNKFFAVFNNNYRPGFQVNFSTYPTGDGNSELRIHYYKLGKEQGARWLPRAELIGDEDRGRWHRIVLHFKVPSTLQSSDGVMSIWKNGKSLIDVKNLESNGTDGLNYIDEAYFFGWANSGFSEDTSIYVDDVVFSDTPIPPEEGQRPVAPKLKLM